METETRTIKLELNYENLFKQFAREAQLQADRYVRLKKVGELEALQTVLAPLNIAIQSATTTEAVMQFREVIHKIVVAVDQARNLLGDEF